jgi:DNA-binding NarL/FixJ family response regulator
MLPEQLSDKLQCMQANEMIRVALVEDDSSFRDSVLGAVSAASDIVMTATAASLREGMDILKGPPLNVLLVDIGLPDGSGIDLIHVARTAWPQCEVIVATVFGDEGKVLSAIEAGASGYLLKDAMPASLVDEIRSVHAGGSPVSPMIARQLLRRLRPPGDALPSADAPGVTSADATLSAREVQVLERMALGYTMQETAEFLGVAMSTVQTFVRRIYRKLGVCSKVEAIDAGYRRGLLQGR